MNLVSVNLGNYDLKKKHFLDYYVSLIDDYICEDRYGYSNRYSSFRFSKEVHNFPKETNKSFEDLMYSRAEEILKKARNEGKKIAISYSGGVDSVSLLVSFLVSGVKKDELVILLSESSIIEFPYFYDYLKKSGYKLILFTGRTAYLYFDYYSRNHILVTGNCGDMIFFCRHQIENREDYRIFLRSQKFSEVSIEEAEDILRHYQIRETETRVVLWFFEYIIKYSFIRYFQNFQLLFQEKPVIFYDSDDFDSWAFQNIKEVKKKTLDPNEYRKEQKEIIRKFLKNDIYENKGKVRSWIQIKDFPENKDFFYLTSEGFKKGNSINEVLGSFLIG